MTETTPQKPLRVAIVGAGIAGLTTAKSLRHFYPKDAVDIKIYDKATKLSEVGASIGVHTSGLKILDKLGVHAALDESICIRQSSGSPIAFRHWLTDEVLGMQDSKVEGGVEEKYRPARFHRAHLQQVLIEALPSDVELRLATRLVRTSVNPGSDDPVTLSFEDGSSESADVLIAGDGVYSKIRSSYVPEAEVKWLGMIAFRAAFDAALVKDIEGLPADAVRWSGPDDRNFVSGRLGTIIPADACRPAALLIVVVQARASMPLLRSTTPTPTTRGTPSVARSGTKRATWSSSEAFMG